MNPLRWWAPVVSALVALAAGLIPYVALSASGSLPPVLRDHPWPMELLAVAATMITVVLAVRAYRQRRARAAATVSALVASLATLAFVSLVHVLSYGLPPAPKDLRVGAAAPDFTLPDQQGQPVSLASLRGRPALLVFYRGFW